MANRFTHSAENALDQSLFLARELGHTYIGTEHLLLGLLAEKESTAAKLLTSHGITYEQTRSLLEGTQGRGIRTSVSAEDMTALARRAVEQSAYHALRTGGRDIGTEHLLLALLGEEDGTAMKLLDLQGVSGKELSDDTERFLAGMNGRETPGGKQTPTLSRCGTDLCAEARAGRLDPVAGREKETQRLLRILSRRGKNNPCLIGEPGVGKTAIVEGLAMRIEAGNVPEQLRGRRIVSLDLPAMIAGAKYRGEFEERMKSLIDEVRRCPDVILFIDEVHTIVGAGGAEGAIDAANILKPPLARGEIRVIGATTVSEYRRHIEKDAALARRFQPVTVEEATEEETLSILTCLRPALEAHHGVMLPDAVLSEAIRLSVRYLPGRFLPDKAIDLADEAAALVRLRLSEPQGEVRAAEEALARVSREKHTAILQRCFPEAAALRTEEKRLRAKRDYLALQQRKAWETAPPVLTEDDLAAVLREMTGVPVSDPDRGERDALLSLEARLREEVLGQEEAVRSLARIVRRSRTGLCREGGAAASMLFLGPSGVGKTALAKALALALFGTEKALLRFDMSEYAEPHSISRLIGSPPGYVGYGEEGQLTGRVRSHPYSVLLFDEAEKAHPDVFHLFLQILEEGEVTDAEGRQVSFRRCILLFTSNLGAKSLLSNAPPPGFAADRERAEETLRRRVDGEVGAFFHPELLGRLDGVAVFRPLTQEVLEKIAAKQLAALAEKAAENGVSLTFSPDLPAFLVSLADCRECGARKLGGVIAEQVASPLADALLSGGVCAGEAYGVFPDGEKVRFSPKKHPCLLDTGGGA